MKKSKSNWIVVLPALALIIVIGIAVAIKLLSPENTVPADASQSPRQYPNPYSQAETKKPSSFLGGLLGTNPTPTQEPASAEDFSRELEQTVDDGGASEIEALDEEISKL